MPSLTQPIRCSRLSLSLTGVDINDLGQILANGFDSRTGESHAYLVSPIVTVPEPGTLALLGLGSARSRLDEAQSEFEGTGMGWVIFWVLCGVASAIIGGNKGRSGFVWFLFGCLVGPFGILLALMVSKQTQVEPDRHIKWMSNPWLGNADPLGAMPTNRRMGEHRMNTQTGEATAGQKAKAVRARMRQLGASDVGETQMLAAIYHLQERLARLERLVAEQQRRPADRDAGD